MVRTLTEVRKGHGLTQDALGRLVGVSQRTIAAYEAGERRPSPDVMQRLMSVLEVPLEEAWPMLYGKDDGNDVRGEE